MFIRFDRMHEHNRHTDRHRMICVGRGCIASRGKNLATGEHVTGDLCSDLIHLSTAMFESRLLELKTRSSAVAERPRDASCLSIVSFNIPAAELSVGRVDPRVGSGWVGSGPEIPRFPWVGSGRVQSLCVCIFCHFTIF